MRVPYVMNTRQHEIVRSDLVNVVFPVLRERFSEYNFPCNPVFKAVDNLISVVGSEFTFVHKILYFVTIGTWSFHRLACQFWTSD